MSLRIPSAGAAGRSRPAAPGEAAPSIRTVAARYMLVLAVVTSIVSAALLWTATQLERTTDAVTRASGALALAREAEHDAAEYERLADLAYVTREPELAAARAELLGDLRDELVPRAPSAGGGRERDLVEAASYDLDGYLAAREDLEHRGVALDALAEGTRPSYERLRADLGALRDRSAATLASTETEVRRASWLAEVVAIVASVLLVLGVIAVFSAIQRSVSRPLIEISAAIRRFRAGEPSGRPRRRGAREMRELFDAFEAMAGALGRQREAQLAFLAGVVHDLRNPLQPLKLAVHALSGAQTPEARGRTIALVDRQVDRLSRMVDDVLDAARIEAGHLELHREIYDLRTSVRDAAELFAPTSAQHDIVLDAPAEPIPVDADPLRIAQVVVNLVSNAIKYSPRGGRVDVRVAAGAEEAVIEVRDRGIGIAPEAVAELFEPFRRRAPDVASGAGIGLSVARRIVIAHGGAIDVESAPGQGSTFRVRVPLAPPPVPPVAPVAPAQSAPAHARAPS